MEGVKDTGLRWHAGELSLHACLPQQACTDMYPVGPAVPSVQPYHHTVDHTPKMVTKGLSCVTIGSCG